MNTRKVTVIAIALVVLCASITIYASNVNKDGKNDNSNVIASSEFLANVDDDDGFGLSFSLDQDEAYELVRTALIGINADGQIKDDTIIETIESIQNSQSLQSFLASEGVTEFTSDAGVVFDVNVSTLSNGDRKIEGKLYAEAKEFTELDPTITEDNNYLEGFEEGVSPYSSNSYGVEISADLAIVVSDDMIKSFYVFGDLSFRYTYETNYEKNSRNFSLSYVEDRSIVSETKMETVSSIELIGMDSLSEFIDFLVDIDSEDSLTIQVDTLTTGLIIGTYENYDSAYYTDYLSGYQTAYIDEYEIPAGALALLLANYGLDTDDTATLYELLSDLANEGIVYDTVYPILKMAGIDMTKEEYDALVAVAENHTLPAYSVLGPMFERSGIQITEEEYNCFLAIVECLKGDLSYDNVAEILSFAGYDLTQEQYDLICDVIDTKTLPTYSVFSSTFGDELGITEEQYNAIYALATDGTLPSYAVASPILEQLGISVNESDYTDLVSLYDSIRNDPSYENMKPIFDALGIPIAESEYNIIYNLYQHRDNITYSDVSPIFELIGLDITETEYNRLIEMYSEVQNGLTPELMSEFLQIMGIDLNTSQCNLLFAFIQDHEIPEYEEISPILEMMGLSVSKDVYDLYKEKFTMISKGPSYFSIQAILEEAGIYVSEETFDDATGFLRGLADGLSDIKKDNFIRYVDWGDTSVMPENKEAVRKNAAGVDVTSEMSRFVDSDENYSITFQTSGDFIKINEFECSDDDAKLSNYFDKYTVVSELIRGYTDVYNGIYYDISYDSYKKDGSWVSDDVIRVCGVVSDQSKFTIPAQITIGDTTYDVVIKSGLSVTGVDELTIDAYIRMYQLEYIDGANKVILNNIDLSSGYKDIDANRFVFPQAIDGVLYSPTYSNYASIIGFTESKDYFTVPSYVTIDDVKYSVSGVRNCFNTTVGTLDISNVKSVNIYNAYGVLNVVCDGKIFVSGTNYGLSSSELVCCDDYGAIISLNGTLMGANGYVRYYDVSQSPIAITGVSLSRGSFGVLDLSSINTSSYWTNTYSINGHADTVILGSNDRINGIDDTNTIYWKGIEMHRASYYGIDDVSGTFCFIDDSGAIYSLGVDINKMYTSSLSLVGFRTNIDTYKADSIVTVGGIAYVVSPSNVCINTDTVISDLYLDSCYTNMMSLSGVVNLHAENSYISYSGVSNLQFLVSIYNINYNQNSINTLIDNAANLEYISFSRNSSVPWDFVQTWSNAGKSIATYQSTVLFNDETVVTDADFSVLDVNKVIGENVKSITFTGKIESIQNTWSSTIPSNLETIVFSQKVDSIGSNSFYDCLKLANITFNGGVGNISGTMFSNCSSSLSISINGDVGCISGYTNVSKIVFDTNVRVHSIADYGVAYGMTDAEVLSLSAITDNTDINAFANAYCSGWSKSVTADGVTFRLYKENGLTKAYVTANTGSGIPASVTFNSESIPVGLVKINDAWTFQNGLMTVPAGVDIESCSVWDSITDIVSYSDHIIVCSYPSDNGYKTVMRPNGDLLAIIGQNTGGCYTIPSALRCSSDTLVDFLKAKSISDVVCNDNVLFKSESIGGYTSLIYSGELIYVTGYSPSSTYFLPTSVRYIDDLSVLGELKVDAVNNRYYTSYMDGGYNTLLYGGALVRIVGSGSNYTVPSGMYYGDPYTYIDSDVSISVAPGNRVYAIIETPEMRLLTNSGSIIRCWHIGSGTSFTVPNDVTSVNLSLFNDVGIDTIILGENVRYLYGTITSDSQIANVYVENSNICFSLPLLICKELTVFSVSNDESVGTYSKTADNIYLQYIGGKLIYAECTDGYTGDVIIDVDEGTTYVALCSLDVDAVSLPYSVTSYSGSGIVLYENYYLSCNGASSKYKVNVSGNYSYNSYYWPAMDIQSVNGSVLTVSFIEPDHYAFTNISGLIDVSGDYTVYLTIDTCTITYHINSNEAVYNGNPTTVEYGKYCNPSSLERGGYSFDGWYKDEELTQRFTGGNITSDIDLYAKWSLALTVTVHYPDDTTLNKYVSVGGSLYLDGYDLYTDSEYSNYYGKTAITKDVHLYALPTYSVQIKIGTGYCNSISTSKLAINGTELVLNSNYSYINSDVSSYAQRKAIDITGWHISGSNETLSGEISISGAIVIEADYVSHRYTVTFSIDSDKGTSEFSSSTFIKGSYIDLPDVTASKGYRFVGWVDGFRIIGEDYCVTEDLTLEAAFVRIDVSDLTLTYSVDSEKAALSVTDDNYVECGIVYRLPEPVCNEGYVFSGWECDGKVVKAPFIIRDDMTLNAVFDQLEIYRIKFVSDGSTVLEYDSYSGSEITRPSNPVKESSAQYDYKFDHWEGYANGMLVSSDATFEAVFNQITRTYTLKFVGESTEERTFEYGTSVADEDVPAVPLKDSTIQYTYSNGRWAGFTEGMIVEGDMTFNAEYDESLRVYRISFFRDSDDAEPYYFCDVEYGKAVTLPGDIPSKEGKAFIGWDGLISIVEGDRSYYPIFANGTQKENEDGSTTVTITDGDVEKTIEYATDGSVEEIEKTESAENGKTTSSSVTTKKDQSGQAKEIIEKVKTSEEKDGVSTVVESVIEKVLDNNGKVSGSTEKIDTKEESASESYSKTAQSTKDSNGETYSSNVVISIESKDSGVKTSAVIKTNGKDSESVINTVISTGSEEKVKDSDIQTAIKQLEKASDDAAGKVEKMFQITSGSESDQSSSTVLSAESLSAIGSKDVTLSMKSKVGVINIDPAIAKNLSTKSGDSSSDVSMSIAKTDNSTLTDAQQRVVKGHSVFQLTASVGGESIHELGGKATVTVPYELKDGENPNKIVVFFVDDNGTVYKRVTTYDIETHTISFETDHFSYYVVAQEEDLGSVDSSSDSSENKSSNGVSVGLIIGGVVAAIAVIAVVAVIIIRRH